MRREFVLGVNLGAAKSGKVLHDGAACLIDRQRVIGALAEERLVRTKRAGGYMRAALELCDSFGIQPRDLHSVVVSSCCEPRPKIAYLPEFPGTKVVSCNHHVSHALSVFCTSRFERAITLVLDAGGNTLSPMMAPNWWETEREQQTYFLCERNSLTKIGADFEAAYCAGYGEIFRAFTYFLGWHSSRHAGNLMALSAYGDSERLQGTPLFSFDNAKKLRSPVKNDPINPVKMAADVLSMCKISGITPRTPGDTILDVHMDLAAWVQREFELSLCALVNRLIKKTDVVDICLAGGVAYNCKAINTLRNRSEARDIYVGPASGDHGQSLGNAIYGLWKMNENIPRFSSVSPYLGPKRAYSKGNVMDLLRDHSSGQSLMVLANCCKFVANLLAMGHVVGWYQDRSEFGPRALGNRSILATPSLKSISSRLNRIKGRESFMPFAPSVLGSEVDRYFSEGIDIPYMSEVLYAREEEREKIVGVLNSDGSARIHVVTDARNSLFFDLIREFFTLTGIPMVLNTSFNGAGQPIVETAADAVACFFDLELDALVIGDMIILDKAIMEVACETVSMSIGNSKAVDTPIQDIPRILRQFRKNWQCIPRDRFLLQAEFFGWVCEGKKTTTIRYRRDAADYPIGKCLPLYVTDDFSHIPRDNREAICRIEGYQVKAFGELTDSDAIKDGFRDVLELSRVLSKIYGDISNNEPVVIYRVALV